MLLSRGQSRQRLNPHIEKNGEVCIVQDIAGSGKDTTFTLFNLRFI